MILNYWMIVERYPKLNGVVGSLMCQLWNLLSNLMRIYIKIMIFSVIWYIMSLMYLYGWHFLWISGQICSWVLDEFIHWPKPYLLLSTTCDAILSWMMEIEMKIQLISGNNCNARIYNLPKKLQEMINNVGLTLSVCDTIPWFPNCIEKEYKSRWH